MVVHLADGTETSCIKVDALTETSEAEIAEYEAEIALREQFKEGAYAKTVEGKVVWVMKDASSDGKVKVRLVHGQDIYIDLDALTEASESEIAEYDAAY